MPKISTVVAYSYEEIRESLIAAARKKTGVETGAAQVEFTSDEHKQTVLGATVTLTDNAREHK